MEVNEKEYQEFLEWVKKQSKVWKPKYNENYFFIDCMADAEDSCWTGGNSDDGLYLIGNCFKTKEEAEFMIEKLKVIAWCELPKYK